MSEQNSHGPHPLANMSESQAKALVTVWGLHILSLATAWCEKPGDGTDDSVVVLIEWENEEDTYRKILGGQVERELLVNGGWQAANAVLRELAMKVAVDAIYYLSSRISDVEGRMIPSLPPEHADKAQGLTPGHVAAYGDTREVTPYGEDADERRLRIYYREGDILWEGETTFYQSHFAVLDEPTSRVTREAMQRHAAANLINERDRYRRGVLEIE